MSRSERIAQQLGMSHGAAANKLRKNILFSLLAELKRNVCFKCSEDIRVVDELSIEHKLPWEGRSAELFWDLDNISFSHAKCNVQHSHNTNEDRRKLSPEGMSWCYRCKEFHLASMFSRDKFRWSGLRAVCREQMKVYKDKYHSEDQSRVRPTAG